jgi:short-subunit dehydrogenase
MKEHEMDSTPLFAVVTGASSGIGYELARVFAKNGYDLLVTSESSAAKEAARDFGSLGPKVQSVQADLATHDGVEKLWQAIKAMGVQSMPLRLTRASASEASLRRPICK